ncbi:unnamed protein product [Sphagnum troendelagicum]|uniref:Uncharacterized protein n=1 Tax=Sphagnum troendelagicum TaxID=128251 RepID=A0ABP0TJZ8_9BRYO
MIKHFSKWLELVPLLNRNNERATYAFLDRGHSRFKVPIEVFIDQACLSYFSPYFFIFLNREPKLPTLIQQNVMVVIKMDDVNVWIQACEQ